MANTCKVYKRFHDFLIQNVIIVMWFNSDMSQALSFYPVEPLNKV